LNERKEDYLTSVSRLQNKEKVEISCQYDERHD